MSEINVIKVRLLLGFFFLLGISGCSRSPKEINILGETMGTTYTVKIVSEEKIDKDKIQHDIDSVLIMVNNQMSTYVVDSEINKFNSFRGSTPFQLSPEFYQVVERAFHWMHLTEGAFDITIMPLTTAWGFGTRRDFSIPSELEITSALKNSGFDQLMLQLSGLQKLNPDVQLDVNAIAKGFGVDVIATYLTGVDISNYMIEIGGEISCSGVNRRGEIWNIGIQSPTNGNQGFLGIVKMNNKAIATSGDYRNFYISEGKTISHIIDPHSGETVTDVSSASVIADNCMDADALATALMVMGKEDGINLIESLNGMEALMIIRDEDGSLEEVMSSGFEFTSVQE